MCTLNPIRHGEGLRGPYEQLTAANQEGPEGGGGGGGLDPNSQ